MLKKALLGVALVLAASPLPLSLGSAEVGPKSPAVRVLARFPIPAETSTPTDVRWATDDSVFVLRASDGLVELALDEQLTKQSRPIPSARELGRIRDMARLAVSGRHIAVAAEGSQLAWRPRTSGTPGTVVFRRKEVGIPEDIDLAGGRLLFLGAPFPKSPYTTGGIAWMGTLGADLEDLKPLVLAPDGRRAQALYRCSLLSLGAVRFLADGTSLVVPGFLPGAYQFDARGNRIRSWSSQELGLDTDCRGVPMELTLRLHGIPADRTSWINQHRVLDDILPLPQGPGLLVRTARTDGKITWELRVLRPQGITIHSLPIVGERPFSRLRGDVRNGKMILLLSSGLVPSPYPEDWPGELILAELPGSHKGEEGR